MGRKGGKQPQEKKKNRPKSVISQKNRYQAYVTSPIPILRGLPVRDGRCVPLVVMSKMAWNRIDEIVMGDTSRECGALLLGNLCRDRITGAVIAFVDDAYTDGTYGDRSSYRFTAAMQADAVNYCMREYGETKHVIGTIHSHGTHDAFFSTVDDDMMRSRRSEEVHMVVSPSHGTYVLCYKGLDDVYSSAVLDVGSLDSFIYREGSS